MAFIDGSNLHNQLKSIGLLEKDIDWRAFFSAVLPDYDLIRASWYHVSRLATHQWYPSLSRRYCPPDLEAGEFEARCRQWYDAESIRLQKLHDEVHSRIAIENDLVDYRYAGVLRVNPYTQERLEEKGVDVGLAVDMVTMVDSYDVAVLVSGDYDFAEAIRFVKGHGRHVHLVTIEPGQPHDQRGQAWGLRVLVDLVTPMFETELCDPDRGIVRNASRALEPVPVGPRGQANGNGVARS
jgi:uncharacterized LabA/DUF88 family protein